MYASVAGPAGTPKRTAIFRTTHRAMLVTPRGAQDSEAEEAAVKGLSS